MDELERAGQLAAELVRAAGGEPAARRVLAGEAMPSALEGAGEPWTAFGRAVAALPAEWRGLACRVAGRSLARVVPAPERLEKRALFLASAGGGAESASIVHLFDREARAARTEWALGVGPVPTWPAATLRLLDGWPPELAREAAARFTEPPSREALLRWRRRGRREPSQR